MNANKNIFQKLDFKYLELERFFGNTLKNGPLVNEFTSGVKRLIAVNHIQDQSLYLHIIYMCTVYMYVDMYKYTHILYIKC